MREAANGTGSRSSFSWDTYGGTFYATGQSNTTSGKSNTANLAGYTTGGGYVDAPYPTAQACNGLSTAGITQGSGNWYQPFINELNVLAAGASAIGNFGSYAYWSSSEQTASTAAVENPITVSSSSTTKYNVGPLRCVRR